MGTELVTVRSGSFLDDQSPFIPGCGRPLIGKQFSQATDGVAHDSSEHVVEVFPGVDAAVFAGLDEVQVQGRRPSAPFTADKHPVLSIMLSHRLCGVNFLSFSEVPYVVRL